MQQGAWTPFTRFQWFRCLIPPYTIMGAEELSAFSELPILDIHTIRNTESLGCGRCQGR